MKTGHKFGVTSKHPLYNRIRSRAWARANKEKKYGHNIKTRYGTDLEAYNKQLKKQGGRCICGAKPIKKRLCNDHDHKTGRSRVLACDRCNFAIGHLEAVGIPAEKTIAFIRRNRCE